eukprot:4361702-Prymnesium_polylepis.1
MVERQPGESPSVAEVSLRSRLQNMLCPLDFEKGPEGKQVHHHHSTAVTTPLVVLVVGGGLSTLRTVLQALQDKRPVVVLTDSGQAAVEIYE